MRFPTRKESYGIVVIGLILESIFLLGIFTGIQSNNQNIKELEKELSDQGISLLEIKQDSKAEEKSLNSEIDMLKSKLDVLDNAIDSDKKRRTRISKVVLAIQQVLPQTYSNVNNCKIIPTPAEIARIAGTVIDMSDRYGVPASLILGVIRQESAFCNSALSATGARGYMQLMPDTAAKVAVDIGAPLFVYNGRDNIQLGTAYLSQLLNMFNGNIELAVKSYYQGPNSMKKVIAKIVAYCLPETEEYFFNVSKYKEIFEHLGIV